MLHTGFIHSGYPPLNDYSLRQIQTDTVSISVLSLETGEIAYTRRSLTVIIWIKRLSN